MADYFVDLSSGTAGVGTFASPWNAFTATQSATVSGGDNIWFNRYYPSAGTDLIVWKAGPASNSRINYIGWPLEGDEFYASRPEEAKAAWDGEPDQYLYQTKAGQYDIAVTLVSNITLHRFYIRDSYTSPSYYHYPCRIASKDSISINNCYFYQQELIDTNSYWYAGLIYIDYSTNITISGTTFDGNGDQGYYKSNVFKLKWSEVTYNYCTFIIGQNNTEALVLGNLESSKTSYAENCNLTMNNCNIYNRMYFHSTSIGSRSDSLMYFNGGSCHVTISGCTVYQDNPNNSTSYMLPNYGPIFSFRANNLAEFNIIDTHVVGKQNRHGFVEVTGTTNLYMDNVFWDIDAGRRNLMFLDVRTTTATVHLKNITGTTPYYDSTSSSYWNVFLSFWSWNGLSSITFDNVSKTLGPIIDASRDAAMPAIDWYDVNIDVLSHIPVQVFRISDVTMENCNFSGFVFNYKTSNTGHYIQGGTVGQTKVKYLGCGFNNVPITIDTASSVMYDVIIYNCVGAGTSMIEDRGGTSYAIRAKALRNIGFIDLGNVNSPRLNESYTSMNDYDAGSSNYSTKKISYSTNTLARVGGAGFTTAITKHVDDDIKVTYPILGDETTWVYFPAPGDFTIDAYMVYTTTSGVLENGDLGFEIDIVSAFSELFTGGTIAPDSASEWNETVTDGNFISLHMADISVPKAQYCPVRFAINRKLPNQIIYFDPKLVVTEIL